MIRSIFALALVCLGVLPVHADDGVKVIGTWIVSAKDDRFEDGGTFFAMTADGGGEAFAVRCIQKELSIALGKIGDSADKLTAGQKFGIKLRVDKQPIIETSGVAISEKLIQAETKPEMVKTIRTGKETAVRIENEVGVTATYIFKTMKTEKAFARLAKECKLD